MAKVSTEKFVEFLKRSGLVDDERLNAALGDFIDRSGGHLPHEPQGLAELLVENGVLTRWQAGKLLKGKYKGFLLGKYLLLDHLGSGGMSSVYLAENTRMHNRVAIKVLPRNKVKDSSYLERFFREARAAASLNHRNVVRAIDIDQVGQIHYFVMEYIDGPDLQSLISRVGPLDYASAASFIAQAADGLQHAHDSGLIHRDVKPANLLLDAEQTVKILDLGLAKVACEDKDSLTIEFSENVLGTADFLAPEQARDSHDVDARADIYSLGCTFYFLLTGRPPFATGTLAQRLMKHQTELAPSIYDARPDAPRELVELCERMMAKSPDDRFQTAAEVASRLLVWLGVPAAAQSSAVGAAPTTPASGRRSAGSQGTDPTAPDVELLSGPLRTGDTISSAEGDTVKGTAMPPRATPAPSSPGSSNLHGADQREQLGQRESQPELSLQSEPQHRQPSEASGEFVFDQATPSGSSRSSSSRHASMSRRLAERCQLATPWWMWATVALAALTILGLLVLVLNH